jgi:general secretion pathway protein N
MKRIVTYSLIGLCSYLIFMVILFPASLAWYLAKDEFQKQLPHWQLSGLQNTVWNGQADSLSYQDKPVGQLSWRLNALSLAGLQIRSRFSLQSAQGHLQGKLNAPLSGTEITLRQVEARFPIQELSRFLTTLPTKVDGSISMNLSELVLDNQGMPRAVQGTVIWHQASVTVTEKAVPLGDLRIALRSDDNGHIHATVRDSGGPLSIEAEVQLQPNGQYRMESNFAAADGATDGLEQLLSWFGHIDNRGRYQFNYTGQLKR